MKRRFPKCRFLDKYEKSIVYEGYLLREMDREYMISLRPNPQIGLESMLCIIKKKRVEIIEHSDEEIIKSAWRLISRPEIAVPDDQKPHRRSTKFKLGLGTYEVEFDVISNKTLGSLQIINGKIIERELTGCVLLKG